MKGLLGALLLALLLAVGCATPPSRQAQPPEEDLEISEVPRVREVVIDYDELQGRLLIRPARDELGLIEKKFNTCDLGSGFPSAGNCMTKTFTLIQFRLECRSTDDTVSSLNEFQLTPISSNGVKFKLGLVRGTTETDQDGYGQVRAVTPGSSRSQNLRLTVGENILQMRADQVKRLIVPAYWCR